MQIGEANQFSGYFDIAWPSKPVAAVVVSRPEKRAVVKYLNPSSISKLLVDCYKTKNIDALVPLGIFH